MPESFKRLLISSSASNFSDGLVKIAAPLLAAFLTRDPVLISFLSSLSFLPWLLFAIPIGGISDRVERFRLLAFANLIRVFIFGFGTYLVFNLDNPTAPISMTIYWLYVIVFLVGVCEVIADTASQSILPDMLSEDLREKGNAHMQTAQFVVQEFVGVPLAGVLFAISMFIPFFIGSIGFAIAWVLLMSLASTATRLATTSASKNFIAELKFGLKFLYEEKNVFKLVVMTTLMSFFFAASSATIILYALDVVGIPESSFGLVMMLGGIGGLIGSIVTPKLSARFGRGQMLAIGISIAPIAVTAQGLSSSIVVFVLASFVTTFSISIWNILLMSMYQYLIPSEIYGRIHGARRTLVWGVSPLGAVIGGVLATIDLRLPIVAGGLATLLVALLSTKFVVNLGNLTTNRA
jgi:MFS family permease